MVTPGVGNKKLLTNQMSPFLEKKSCPIDGSHTIILPRIAAFSPNVTCKIENKVPSFIKSEDAVYMNLNIQYTTKKKKKMSKLGSLKDLHIKLGQSV